VNRSKPPSDCSALIDYWVQWDVDEWVRDLKKKEGEGYEKRPYLQSASRSTWLKG